MPEIHIDVVALSIATIGFIAWLVKVEVKSSQNEREISSMRDESKELELSVNRNNERMVDHITDLNKNIQTLTIEVAKMMERLEHTNKKVLDLTAKEIENYLKDR